MKYMCARACVAFACNACFYFFHPPQKKTHLHNTVHEHPSYQRRSGTFIESTYTFFSNSGEETVHRPFEAAVSRARRLHAYLDGVYNRMS